MSTCNSLSLSLSLSFSLSLSPSLPASLPYLDSMCIFQRSQGIDVFDILVPEGDTVAPVQGANVILDTFNHL